MNDGRILGFGRYRLAHEYWVVLYVGSAMNNGSHTGSLCAEVTHAAIPVDEVPSVGAYPASCTTRPVVDKGRAGANDLGRVGGR